MWLVCGEFAVGDDGDFAGDAFVAPKVGAVGEGFVVDFDGGVVEVDGCGEGSSGGCVEVGKVENVGFGCGFFGGIVDADFATGGDHAFAVDAAEFGFFNFN